jgi:putative NADH-flavin reductase
MKPILIGANGTIGELIQKALAGAGHEIVKVGRKSGDFQFQVEIENRESVRKLYQAVGSFDAVAIAAGQVAFAPLSELGQGQRSQDLQGYSPLRDPTQKGASPVHSSACDTSI